MGSSPILYFVRRVDTCFAGCKLREVTWREEWLVVVGPGGHVGKARERLVHMPTGAELS